MKQAIRMMGIVGAVLGWLALDAMAQAPAPGRPSTYVISIVSPFKGVVVKTSVVSITVNGEVKLIPRRTQKASGSFIEPKTEMQDVEFAIKDATFTRDGKPCKLTDIKKGDNAVIECTSPKQGVSKYIASEVILTSKGEGRK